MGRWLAKTASVLWRILNFIRNLVFNLVFLFLAVLIIVSLPGSSTVTVPDEATLVVSPGGELVDAATPVALLEHLTGSAGIGETVLPDLLNIIDHARENDRIRSLELRLDDFQGGGFSKLRELAEALQRFRDSGKQVIATASQFDQARYYVASVADEIILDPMGAVELQGFYSYQPYLRDALDSLGVNIHIFRVGDFKSAVEPFRENAMSADARADTSRWLERLWDLYLTEVAQHRGLDIDTLQTYVNNPAEQMALFDGDSATLALETGLVDRLADHVEKRRYLQARLGSPDADGHTRIDARDYGRMLRQREQITPATPAVGVITARGTILDGEQQSGVIGADTLAASIRHAREDEQIRALVLRIDTGGGSATASEKIRRELMAFRDSGKPVVVSMSSVTASGGYWIASAADSILASPATLTGSIGIYTLRPTFDRVLDNLGINVDGVGTTPLSDAYVPGRPLPEAAAATIQLVLERGYRQFIDVVAQGRDMSTAEVEAVAQGQVWTGAEAQTAGLVDRLGDLPDAIATAAQLAGLDDYHTRHIEETLTPFQQFIRNMTIQALTPVFDGVRHHLPWSSSLWHSVSRVQQELDRLVNMNDPRGLYLHCLECRLY